MAHAAAEAGTGRAALATWGWASALFLLALTVRVLLIWRNEFDGLYGQDAYAYIDAARQLLASIAHRQLPPYFWWPLGYPGLLDLGLVLFGASARSAQLVTVLSGAALAPLVFLLTCEVGGITRAGGVLAGALAALGGQAVQSSVVIMADAPGLMWSVLGAWLLLRYRRTFSGAWLYGSALALALSLLTRWENAGFALAWLAALFVCIRPEWTKVWKTAAIALTLAGCIVLAQLAYNVAFAAPLAGQSWLQGWGPANFILRSFDTVDGHFDYALPVSIFYAQVMAHPAYLFPALAPFLVIGAWRLVRRAPADPLPGVLLLGWIVVMYSFLSGIPYENFRFGLGFFGPVAAVTGIGVSWAWEQTRLWSSETTSPLARGAPLALVLLILVSLAGAVYWEPRVLQPVLAEKQMELEQVRWLDARVPSGARLYTFAVTGALQYYSDMNVADLSEETPDRIGADVAAIAPAYLFLDVANIQTQWRGLQLERTFDTLRTQVGLEEFGSLGRWTLYRIGASP